MSKQRERLVVGCMTGTSLDGLDVALTRITGSGLEMKAEYVGMHTMSLPTDLRESLMHLASGGSAQPLVYMRAARQLGEIHAQAVAQLLKENNNITSDFIVAHGQTIWHAPRGSHAGGNLSGDAGMSWQLFDPWPVVKRIGVPVCYDLRQADLIAGGEGAPLTPLADWVMYRDKANLIVNLGGVLNHTWCPSESVSPSFIEGGDACLCNLLLDGLAQHLLGEPIDRDGQMAAQGRLVDSVLHDLQDRFEVLGISGGTLGREDLQGGAIESIIAAHSEVRPADLLFSTIAFVGQTIGEIFEGMAAQRLVLAGGGARNKTLVRYIRDIIEHDSFCEGVYLSDDLGIPCEAREAMGFAVLGALSQDGVPISLPQVTGATDPGVAGVWAGA